MVLRFAHLAIVMPKDKKVPQNILRHDKTKRYVKRLQMHAQHRARAMSHFFQTGMRHWLAIALCASQKARKINGLAKVNILFQCDSKK